ncbi:MAG TPA: S8 family serine peptidase, partial [Candidatus Obscuribacterales bacterium]
MAGRVVIVPQTSEILHHSSTQILHRYENDEVLVRTEAPVAESGADSELAVSQGVLLPDSVIPIGTDAARSRLNFAADDTERYNAYIELIGPVDPRWLTTLSNLGIELLQFQPENSYLCRGTGAEFDQAAQQPFVLNVLPLVDAIKPRTVMPETGTKEIWVLVHGTQARSEAIAQELAALPGVTINLDQEIDAVDFYLRIRATVTPDGQDALLQQAGVLAVEPYEPPKVEDEVAGLIIAGQYDAQGRPQGSYLRWLEDRGLNGEGVTIGIVDAGVDALHPAFGDRAKDLSDGKKSWHGTFVAGHAAGCYLQEKDSNQFMYGLGMAPQASLLIQDNQRTAATLCRETVTEKSSSGIPGSVQNNSWGAGTTNPMTYGSQEALYDKLVRNADPEKQIAKPLTICFSAGNSGSAGLTRPKAAKNLIVTGNSETYRPDVGKDQSDNINEVYSGPRGSSHGNCGDGRIVPHIVAPGEWTASANYDSRAGDKEYISPKLTWGGGSSAASPKTAGACALLIQWWRRHNSNHDPSPAMLKALIVNGAEPMQAGGAIPNKLQGWGRLNLENILFEAVGHTYVDQTILLKQRGEQKSWKIRVSDPQQPVKVTLCWTDPPAAPNTGTEQTSTIVNKLALRAEANGKLYRGNQFQNSWSYPEGSPEREGWDNLQNIYLQAGTATETLQVTVTALQLTTNCLTGQTAPPQQDFALVITNGRLDEGSTSAAVFVAIDNPTQTTKSDQSGGFWASGKGNSDAVELHYDWWQSLSTTPTSPSFPGQPSRNPTTASKLRSQVASAAELWWLQDQKTGLKAESDRQSLLESESTQEPSLIPALEVGIAAIAAGAKHQVVLTGGNSLETQRNSELTPLMAIHSETEREQISAYLAQTEGTSLSQALDQLMHHWQRFGIALEVRGAIARKVAVLVVRAGTLVTHADLLAMRQLAFLGELYLVADDAQILTFLAQRIHRLSGVQFRLAEDSRGLATLVQDTLIEASGGQQVEVSQSLQLTNGITVSHCVFQVLEADHHLTIRIEHSTDQRPQISLYTPEQVPITLSPDVSIAGIEIQLSPGALQIDLEPTPASAWKGQWKILLSHPEIQKINQVRVWAWSDLQWRFRQQATQNQVEAERAQTDVLMTVSGTSGATLSHLQSQPRVISASAIAAESERDIDITVEAPRQSQEGIAAESEQEVRAAAIGAFVQTPRTPAEAVVVDLPMRVVGADAAGQRFTRLVRHSLIQLEPRSHWRQRLAQPEPLIFTTACITEIHKNDDEVVGLTLQKGDRQRRVHIISPALRQQLAHLTQLRWSAKTLVVGIVGDELYGLYW